MSARVECAHGALVYGLETDTVDVPLTVSQDLFLFVEQGLTLVEQLVVFGEEQVDFTMCLALEVEGVEVVECGLGLIERERLLDEVVAVDFLVEVVASPVEV